MTRCEDRGSVGGDAPAAVSERARRRGLAQVGSLGSGNHFLEVQVVDRVLGANAKLVERYRAGNSNLLGALVGQVMRETGNRANPTLTGELLRQKLG